jgi:phosphohistidine phosphatase
MKTLILLRHAKSDWDDDRLSDHDRPLSKRGRKAAPLIGRWLAEHAPAPDLILCSTALRTRETLDLVRAEIGEAAKVAYEPGLYLAEADRLLARIRRLPKGLRTVLMVGHNPGFEELARDLTGSGDAGARASLAAKYPTGALALLRFQGDGWSGVGEGRGRLEAFVTPKALT